MHQMMPGTVWKSAPRASTVQLAVIWWHGGHSAIKAVHCCLATTAALNF